MKTVKTSALLIAILGLLTLCIPAWAIEGMVSYWKLDEGSGTMVHDYWGDNHGTIYGAQWTTGIIGAALDFDGVDDYVLLPDIEVLPSPLTICAWVNIQDNTLAGNFWILGRTHANVPGEYSLAFRDNSANYGLYLDVYRETGTFWKAYEAQWTNESCPTGWHFYCGSWDGVARCENFGEGIKLYVDGELQNNVTGGGTCILYPRSGTHLTAIGVYESREPPYPAPRSGFAVDPIDEVAIFNRVLTTEEIQQLYQNCLHGQGYLTILVGIDIKPGSYPNAINLGSHGLIPVAILSSEDFDATEVDPETVELAGSGVAVRGKSNKYMAHEEDVSGDGLIDLVVKVATENLIPGDFQDGYAILTGETFGGEQIKGEDEITIVPPE